MATTRPIAHTVAALAALVLCAALAAVPTTALAGPGTNGWYWPTGHSATSTGGGWLQHRYYSSGGEAWHLAWDDCGTVHEPVYSLGWGVVEIADMHVNGYGWNPVTKTTAPGGAIVIKYRTSDGSYFKALYGHLDFNEADLPVGSKVYPGQQIAVTTAYSNVPHVHFGIHLGEADPVAPAPYTGSVSILMGHTHQYTLVGTTKVPVTYGWVDPVLFLNTYKPWIAPPARIATPTVPVSVPAGRTFRVFGSFEPTAPVGTRSVVVQCDRFEGGVWVRRATHAAVNQAFGTDATRYVAPVRLPLSGPWRVRAYARGDLGWSSATSGWAPITVR